MRMPCRWIRGKLSRVLAPLPTLVCEVIYDFVLNLITTIDQTHYWSDILLSRNAFTPVYT